MHVSVSLVVPWWGWSGASACLGPLVDESQLHPKAVPPVLQQLRPANAEFRPYTALF